MERLVEHIPDKGFKMIRYYGFLSNRHRGEMLPKVYKVLKMEEKKKPTMPGYAAMLKGYVNVDPYECVLCQSRLVFNGYRAGTPLSELTASTLVQASMMPA